MRVDFHTHIIPEDLPNLNERYGGNRWPTVERTCSCGANIMIAGNVFREITDQCLDPETRIQDMGREHVDLQVLSPIPVTFSYWAPAEEAEALARLQNDFIADNVRRYPHRFLGLGAVPLQNPDVAIREMDRCMHALGLKGIEIGTNVNGKNLDDPALLEFFQMAAEWNVPLFVHPWETLGLERMPRHNLMYTVGMPSETALAAASLILGGVIEKFPQLKICFAHGGGSFPYLLPRLDKGWNVWPHLRQIANPPSHYTGNFYFDALVNDPVNVQYLVEMFGHERVVMGSDYPFLLREVPPGAAIERTMSLSEEQRAAIFGANALRFLNVDVGERL